MGKGAGGCDDRPAFAISGAVLADEQPTVASAYDRLLEHRNQHPGNMMLALGTPASNDQSDRVRFRKMIKQLEGEGEIVRTWEQSVNEDPTVTFDPSRNPVWTSSGAFQYYGALRVHIAGDDDERTDRLNRVQAALQAHGFYGVITLEKEIFFASKLSHQSAADDGVLNELQITQAECIGQVQSLMYLQDIDVNDEATLARTVEIFTHPALQRLGVDQRSDWAASEYSIDEIVAWVEMGIPTATVADAWQTANFSIGEATDWIDNGWYWNDYSGAQAFRDAGVDTQRAKLMREADVAAGDHQMFDEQTWISIQSAYDGNLSHNKGSDYMLRSNIRAMVAEYADAPTDPNFERDLQWLEAGFNIYSYNGERQDPWMNWKECTPRQARDYMQAGFTTVPSGGGDRIAVVKQWHAACDDLSLTGDMISQLNERGVTPDVFMTARAMTYYEQDAGQALIAGWDLERMSEWKDLLQARRFEYINLFYEAGAQPVETAALIKADVSPSHYATLRDAFAQTLGK